MNNGGLRSIINKFLIMIVSLFVITLILKGLVFLVPICVVGFLLYKGIKIIKSKFQDVTSIKGDKVEEVNYDFSKEDNFDSNVIDVEYEEVEK